MPTQSTPTPPRGASKQARDLWSSVVDRYDLDEHEMALLRQAVETLDMIGKLTSDIDVRGTITATSQGQRVNASIVEVRQQRIALARLLAALRLPSGDVGDQQSSVRPQRRQGVRGLYNIDGSAS